MTPVLFTPLRDIDDADIEEVVADLCEMVGNSPEGYAETTLFSFLQIVFKRPAAELRLDFVAHPRAVNRRLEKLQGHSFYAVCRELQRGSVEASEGVSLLTFLKRPFAPLRRTE